METLSKIRRRIGDGLKDRLLAAALILLAANCLLRLTAAVVFPLFYKEAYFWEWSRFLSSGYLEHPPLVAWLIRAAQFLSSEPSLFGIRLGAVLFGTGSLGLVYLLGKELFQDRRIAFRSLAIAAGLPVLNVVGVLMLPEAPLLFFHLLFLWLFVRVLRERNCGGWVLAGLAGGFALLSQLTAALAIAAAAMFLISSPAHRFWLRRRQPYLACFLSLLGFSPYLWWNATNDFATLRFYLRDHYLGDFTFSLHKLCEAFVEQAANAFLISLPLFGVLFLRRRDLPEAWRDGFRLLRYQAATVLVFFLAVGAGTETHPHWTVLAYPPLAVALAAVSTLPNTFRFMGRLTAVVVLSHLSLTAVPFLVVLGLPRLEKVRPELLGDRWGKKAILVQRRLTGWREIERKLKSHLPHPSGGVQPLLFGDEYKQASVLSFGRRGDPVINLAPFFRRRMVPGDAQAFYIPWDSLSGKNGFFVAEDRRDSYLPARLAGIFDQVREDTPWDIEYPGGQMVRYRVFEVRGFHPERRRRLLFHGEAEVGAQGRGRRPPHAASCASLPRSQSE